MAEQYQVLTDELTKHTKHVAGFAERMAQAVAAAREVSLPTDAYGLCCIDLPLMLNPLKYLGTSALYNGAQRLGSTATEVKQAAEGYAEIDDRNTLALHRAMEVG